MVSAPIFTECCEETMLSFGAASLDGFFASVELSFFSTSGAGEGISWAMARDEAMRAAVRAAMMLCFMRMMCLLQVASCGLRVARGTWVVAGCELRVARNRLVVA